MKPVMSRHDRTLLQIGTVLIGGMLVLRLSHSISGAVAQALLIFGGLFVVSALARHNKRLKAENHTLRTRPDDYSAPR